MTGSFEKYLLLKCHIAWHTTNIQTRNEDQLSPRSFSWKPQRIKNGGRVARNTMRESKPYFLRISTLFWLFYFSKMRYVWKNIDLIYHVLKWKGKICVLFEYLCSVRWFRVPSAAFLGGTYAHPYTITIRVIFLNPGRSHRKESWSWSTSVRPYR